MTAASSNQFPWRWQISLRTLLVVIFVLGVCFGWMADHLSQTRVIEQQFRSLEAYHNERVVALENDLQLIKQGSFGIAPSPELTALVRKGASISTAPSGATLGWAEACDEDLAQIANMRTLTHLALLDGQFTPRGMARLHELPRLESLSLRGPWCDGNCFAQVAFLNQLTSLRIDGARLDDQTLAPVSKLELLRSLGVRNTPVSDFATTHLSSLTRLEQLSLEGTVVGDDGLAHLQRLDELRTLNLNNTQVSDAGLVHLQTFERLYELRLNQTSVTDVGLLQMTKLPRLKVVTLIGTRVTEAGAMEFRRKRPTCSIAYGKGEWLK